MKNERIFLGGIFTFAFIVGILSVKLFIGFETPPSYDGIGYDHCAVNILQGNGFSGKSGPTAIRPPLYALFLASIYFVWGHSYAVVRISQLVLHSFTCILIYFLGRNLFNRNVGIIASIGACFHPLLIYQAGIFYSETLFLFLLVSALLYLIKAAKSSKRKWVDLSTCGILLGLVTLTRASIAAFIPFIAVWFFLTLNRKMAIKTCVIVLFFWGITLTPWTIRNYIAFHDFIPLSTNRGQVFWSGNHSLARGGAVIPSKETWEGGDYPDSGFSGWRELGEYESSKKFLRAGLQWVKTHPGQFIASIPQKLYRLYSPTAFAVHSDRKISRKLSHIVSGPYVLFLVFVLYGIIVSRKSWRILFVLYSLILSVTFTAAVFSGGTRYSVPMVPALLVFSALGINALISYVRGKYIVA